MKEVKKILINGLAFLCISICIYLCIFYLLFAVEVNNRPIIYRVGEALNLKGGNTYRKFHELNPDQKYDVIVLGSSHAYRGYDPRIFKAHGINLYNLGTSGQTMVNSYYIAKNHIAPGTCKLVILDVFDGALIADETESSADLIQNVDDNQTALELAFHLKDPRAINMYLLRLFNSKREPFYIDTTYVKNGYSQNFRKVRGTLNYNFYHKKQISRTQMAYFERLVKYFNAKQIPLVLVNAPLPNTWDFENHEKFNHYIEDIALEHQIPYLDFSSLMKLDANEYFYDAHHLNQYGVDLFNNLLLEKLNGVFLKNGLKIKL